MSRKKKFQKSTPKDFTNSPFKSLKGLSAFEQKSHEQSEPAQLADRCAEDASNEQGAFAAEMDFLGVQPLKDEIRESSETEHVIPHDEPGKSASTGADTDFIEAIGSMEKVFKDEWPEDEVEKQAAPRRMKQLAKGQLKPQDEIDLHGLTVDEATEKVRFFLQNSIYQGLQVVIVITGKGLHSNNGPVLRRSIEKLLGQLSGQVVEWGVAPRRYGGDGAFVVFLRRPEAK
jgi:DNA-nicking Smr family endonuclease